MKLNLLFFSLLISLFFSSCKEQEARRPKQNATTDFYKEVIAENIRLNKLEKKQIELWVAKDTIHNYIASSNGYWYTYKVKNSVNTITAKTNDVATIQFNITDLNDNVIYKKQERKYRVEKEDFIPGLEDGIKLMKKGETITFVIPSYRAYGVVGDGNKIGINQSLKSTLTLIDLKLNKINEDN